MLVVHPVAWVGRGELEPGIGDEFAARGEHRDGLSGGEYSLTLPGNAPTDELKNELKAHVVKDIGALARPDEIKFTDTLPKTRSGKIMRRLLRVSAAGKTSTCW